MHALVHLSIIGSDIDLSPVRSQAIIWTNATFLLIRPWEHMSVKFEENTVALCPKIALKIYSAKLTPFCLGLDMLTLEGPYDVAKSRRPPE